MYNKNLHREKGSAEYINRLNKIVVLNLIRQFGEISRAEIVKQTGLSAPTVTRIVDSLINREGLATQVGMGESSGGRPPLIVRFCAEENFVIGIDWGRTHIHGVVTNLNAEIIAAIDQSIQSGTNFEKDLESVVALVNDLLARSAVPVKKVFGMGVAAAGYVNHQSGTIEFSPNFGWSRVNLHQSLAQHFPFPVVVDNVSRVMALGELWYGLGKQIRNFIFVNIGYGIGSGIIIDGKPYVGFDGFSGEIGHTRLSLKANGLAERKCVCGKTACLECYVSGRGIEETVNNEMNDAQNFQLRDKLKDHTEPITCEKLASAALAGDEFARSVFNEAAEILGTALANFSNAFNPQAVILGGKVTQTGDFFFDKIKEVFDSETLQYVSRPVTLLKSSLPGDEAAKGAIALVLKEVLDLNITNKQ